MGTTTALLRDNPGLLAMVAALAIGAVVFGVLTLTMTRAGTSLRPVLFVGGLYALVLLPQFAFHLGVATGAIPKRNLTWMPAATRASVYGWVENEAALATRDGTFVAPAAVFGAGVDATLGSDLRAAGAATPFGSAEAARMVILPSDGSAIVARFADAAAAEAAAREYAAQAFGLWPPVDANGLRTVTRPAGDSAALAVAGRTVVVVSGADPRALPKRLLSLGAIAPGRAHSDPGSERYWLYRPGVLPLLIVLLGAAYVLAFFKGATWAGASSPAPGATPASESELRRRLLAVDEAGVPFTIAPEPGGKRLVAIWRYADARWLDFARARRMQRVQRLVLELDPEARVVRVTEQASQLDADFGRGGASLEWRTTRGFTFFEVQRGRVFGLQFDADGRPLPRLDYEWRYDSREMKGPLSDAVTRAGWEWRPTPWLGPTWLRWLTG